MTEAIESLRQDLAAAQQQGIGRTVGFSVDGISVELDVQAERSDTVEGGVSWYVTAKRGRTGVKRTGTRLVVTLKPRGVLHVGDRTDRPRNAPPPRSSGPTAAGTGE
ncbi:MULTISPECIES: trypco2 family protein [unclassified Streptomyces]|uniref:trypco2 family protein n=1 Tax=unclassified Streptomyces TaxID=2593676 RepID=UPI00332EDB69